MQKIKAGYQGKKDSMREKAEKCFGIKGSHNFAMGGVAKIRLDQSYEDGMPKKPKIKKSYKDKM